MKVEWPEHEVPFGNSEEQHQKIRSECRQIIISRFGFGSSCSRLGLAESIPGTRQARRMSASATEGSMQPCLVLLKAA